jgi:hypothetical protein
MAVEPKIESALHLAESIKGYFDPESPSPREK